LLLAGRDLLGTAQTGTGKTAAFALPVLHRLSASGNPAPGSGRQVRALVLAPTRELAVQIADSFRGYSRGTPLRSAVVMGGVSQQPQARALAHGVDILVATPGRLLDLVQQRLVQLHKTEVLVVDEADRMLDMGFLPDVRRIVGTLPVNRQTLLFSATMPPAIEQLARTILRQPAHARITPVAATTALIDESVCFVPRQAKPAFLLRLLRESPIARAIVFTRTKHGADRVARQLSRSGIRAEALHGNKSQSARQRMLASFRSSQPPVLVATDLAARGIDVDGVSHVYNFDLPLDAEVYVHRIGRTGRAGASGQAVSLCDPDERPLLAAIERLIRRRLAVDPAAPAPAAPEGYRSPAHAKRRPAAPHGQPAAARPMAAPRPPRRPAHVKRRPAAGFAQA
jgi:ATP-dependent RNA helicase RhlE